MIGAVDIEVLRFGAAYLLLLIPLGIMLWLRVPLVRASLVAVLRMSVQLAFVGLYLHVVFDQQNGWLNTAWVLIMVAVADVSIVRSCRLRLRYFVVPLFLALLAGVAVPLSVFMGPVLNRPGLLEAQYVIPLAGMILGNCLRADIIGVRTFYESVRRDRKRYLLSLAQGADLSEATRPFFREACRSALAPTVATMATIGLVSLPGMMTGVMLGGAEPAVAIKYQVVIMLAIFAGASITVALAIHLTLRRAFTAYGTLRADVLKGE